MESEKREEVVRQVKKLTPDAAKFIGKEVVGDTVREIVHEMVKQAKGSK